MEHAAEWIDTTFNRCSDWRLDSRGSSDLWIRADYEWGSNNQTLGGLASSFFERSWNLFVFQAAAAPLEDVIKHLTERRLKSEMKYYCVSWDVCGNRVNERQIVLLVLLLPKCLDSNFLLNYGPFPSLRVISLHFPLPSLLPRQGEQTRYTVIPQGLWDYLLTEAEPLEVIYVTTRVTQGETPSDKNTPTTENGEKTQRSFKILQSQLRGVNFTTPTLLPNKKCQCSWGLGVRFLSPSA